VECGVCLLVLVVEGLAPMQRTVTNIDGREKMVVWMQITDEGRAALAD
jgi:hypothetical protein